MTEAEALFVRQSRFNEGILVQFKENRRSITEKEPTFGRDDNFQTTPNVLRVPVSWYGGGSLPVQGKGVVRKRQSFCGPVPKKGLDNRTDLWFNNIRKLEGRLAQLV